MPETPGAPSARLPEIEELLRAGRVEAARAGLKTVGATGLPREHHYTFANQARRAGLASLAVSLLHPHWCTDGTRAPDPVEPPTPGEAAEYAASLMRIGATTEALGILRAVNSEAHPEALLFQSFALFSSWNFREAIPCLEQYLELTRDPYAQLAGQVNLASALITVKRGARARLILSEALTRAHGLRASFLYGNCLELSAQLALAENRLPDAEHALDEASRYLAGNALYQLLLRKWRAVLALKRRRAEGEDMLAAVRVDAMAARHWETVRDCDFQRVMLLGDERVFRYLYFGTPWVAYRRRLRAEFDGGSALPETYAWEVDPSAETPADRSFDLTLGEETAGHVRLAGGRLPHRLLQILASDFYRPFRPVALFGALFPTDRFHPETSLDRVHQGIRRLREWFTEAQIPLALREERSDFRLEARGPYAILLRHSEERRLGSAEETLFRRLAEGGSLPQEFTALQVSAKLGISKRTALRLLTWAVAAGRVLYLARGPRSAYVFRG